MRQHCYNDGSYKNVVAVTLKSVVETSKFDNEYHLDFGYILSDLK